MMSAADVGHCLDLWGSAGMSVWLDGGWGVDALVGRQTREHHDLDIAVALADETRFMAAMHAAGFAIREVSGRYQRVMVDDDGREVDVHLVDFTTTTTNEYGDTVYGGVAFAIDSLTGTGRIDGRAVRCVSAEWAIAYRTRYEPDDDDYHDVCVLSETFGIPLPPPYDTWDERATPR